MDIAALSAISKPAYLPVSNDTKPAGQGFDALLNGITKNPAEGQSQADTLAMKVAAGEPVELHEAIIAMEQANVSLQFALQVRNKLVEAYQEVMRMQI